MTEEEEYRLAERLAEALGYRLLERKSVYGSDIIRFVGRGKSFADYLGEWYRRKDVLRGIDFRKGLLDLGTSWPGLDLPKGITKDSTDEEIDIVLSVMGF